MALTYSPLRGSYYYSNFTDKLVQRKDFVYIIFLSYYGRTSGFRRFVGTVLGRFSGSLRTGTRSGFGSGSGLLLLAGVCNRCPTALALFLSSWRLAIIVRMLGLCSCRFSSARLFVGLLGRIGRSNLGCLWRLRCDKILRDISRMASSFPRGLHRSVSSSATQKYSAPNLRDQ